jgi:hypothetical protein
LVAPSYWLQVYGANFPCPRCSDWTKLDQLLATIDPETKAKEIQAFWHGYKMVLRQQIAALVMGNLFAETYTEEQMYSEAWAESSAAPAAVGSTTTGFDTLS